MIMIRLARGGVKKRPFYQIIVTNSRSARDGRFIERVGFFNPITNNRIVNIHIDMSRVIYWTGKGAIPSKRVNTLIKNVQNNIANNN